MTPAQMISYIRWNHASVWNVGGVAGSRWRHQCGYAGSWAGASVGGGAHARPLKVAGSVDAQSIGCCGGCAEVIGAVGGGS